MAQCKKTTVENPKIFIQNLVTRWGRDLGLRTELSAKRYFGVLHFGNRNCHFCLYFQLKDVVALKLHSENWSCSQLHRQKSEKCSKNLNCNIRSVLLHIERWGDGWEDRGFAAINAPPDPAKTSTFPVKSLPPRPRNNPICTSFLTAEMNEPYETINFFSTPESTRKFKHISKSRTRNESKTVRVCTFFRLANK